MTKPRDTYAEWRETLLDDAHDRADELLAWAAGGKVDPPYALQVASTAFGMFAVMVFQEMAEMPPERVDAMLRDQLDSSRLCGRRSARECAIG